MVFNTWLVSILVSKPNKSLQGAQILSWISPTTRVGAASFAYISRNEETVVKKKNLYSEYGSNSGLMACAAVHMMTIQDKLMTEFDQIKVRTLICAGTDDRLSSLSGKILSQLFKSLIFQQSNTLIVKCRTAH